MLSFRQPAANHDNCGGPTIGPAGLPDWTQHMDAMTAAGVMRGASRLEPCIATMVRVRGDQRQVQDGPFADSKELLGSTSLLAAMAMASST